MTIATMVGTALLAVIPQLRDQQAVALTHQPRTGSLPPARANDNRKAAGRRVGDTLHLRLVAREAVWHLDDDAEPGIRMLAFAEEEGEPQIPGPLVRVEEGTTIDVRIRSTLARDTLVVYGLGARTVADSIVVGPGMAVEVRFVAPRRGTYYYWATTQRSLLRDRYGGDSNLSGAFIVDAPGAMTAPGERIFVLSEHGWRRSEVPGIKAPLWTAVNGKSWPHSERLMYQLGDTIRWRVVNTSASPHPMHLHGAYFRVDAKGNGLVDSAYGPAQRRMAATERLLPGETMSVTWSPERPGGWLFHCHAVVHVAPHPPVPGARATTAHHGDPDRHTFHGMSGLVLAVNVPPPRGYSEAPVADRRRLRLLVHSDSSGQHTTRRFGYVLQERDRVPPADSVPLPGPTLVLTRGEPTVIEIVNRTAEPTSVHWHGIELESFYDGVVGVSGLPGRPTPAIRPGTAFEARITPRRAGTFMYHTHFSELRQYVAGLTGALIVLEPGETWNPERDRVFLVGDPRGAGPRNTVNGSETPSIGDLEVGTTYRFRFMNIAVARPAARLSLTRDGRPLSWRAIAKDGWTLDSAQATVRSSVMALGSGETADVEFTPDRPGDLLLELKAANDHLFFRASIRVR